MTRLRAETHDVVGGVFLMADGGGTGWVKGLSHGMEVAVGVGLGYLGGNWFDHKFGTQPWGLFAGLMLGCAAGMYLLVKEAIKENKR